MKTAAVAAATGATMATAYRNKTIETKNIGLRSDKFMNRADGFESNPIQSIHEWKANVFFFVVLLSWLYLGLVWFCSVWCVLCHSWFVDLNHGK